MDAFLKFDLGEEGSALGVLGFVLCQLGRKGASLGKVLRSKQIGVLDREEDGVKVLQDGSPVVRAMKKEVKTSSR